MTVALFKYTVMYQCVIAQANHAAFFMDGSLLTVKQNPVTSAAWLVADISLLGPLVSLTIDTENFCKGLLRTKVTVLFALAHVIIAAITLLLPAQHHLTSVAAYLKLYNFSAAFRLEFAGLAIGGVLTYGVLVNASRRFLNRLQHSRVHPA
ncbi:hypothetical protein ABBQ32_013037 [Trebouxia sp. C0010 RCD-2024]